MNRRNLLKSTSCLPLFLIPDVSAKTTESLKNTKYCSVEETRSLGAAFIKDKSPTFQFYFLYSDLNHNHFKNVINSSNKYIEVKPWFFISHDNTKVAINFDEFRLKSSKNGRELVKKFSLYTGYPKETYTIADRHIDHIFFEYLSIKNFQEEYKTKELILI